MKPIRAMAWFLIAAAALAAHESAAAPRAREASKPAAAAEPAKSEATPERLAIQSDLAWTGDYNGGINGEPGERTTAAIKTFQERLGARQTGTLTAGERETLGAEARKAQEHAGWKLVTDVNGSKLGIPSKLAPNQRDGGSGSKWSSAQGQIQIETWRDQGEGLTLGAIAERERKLAKRRVEYSVVKPDFFVFSGLQGLKKFYVRGQFRNGELRGMTVLYDQATEGIMTPVVVAMSSAFNPFPGNDDRPFLGPQPRRPVEYATGIVASADGAIITDAAVLEGCSIIGVNGHGYGQVAALDKTNSLALVRVHGVTGLKAMGLAGRGEAKSEFAVVGIADPQTQQGEAAATRVTARATQAEGNRAQLSPPPPIGFSGAAIFDAERKFAGLALLRPVQTAGPPPAGASAQIVSGDAVRNFLSDNGVTITASPADPKESVVRVICVRR